MYDQRKPVKPTSIYWFDDKLIKINFLDDLTIKEKAVISSIAGFLGVIVSNPFELVMVRQINDGALPANLRRNYTSAFDGISKIMRTEGGGPALWKGFFPTALKAIVLNSSNKKKYVFFSQFRLFII